MSGLQTGASAQSNGIAERCAWIDCAKGIGILLVVYGHVARGIVTARIPHPGYNHEVIDRFLYSFHMPLFFFLSGLTFLASMVKYGRVGVALRKIDALLYPYLVWSLLQGSIEVFLSQYTNQPSSFTDIFTHLLVPRAQFWFLYALYFVSITAALLYRSTRTWATIFVLALSAAISIIPGVSLSFRPLVFVSAYLVYFTFGVSFRPLLPSVQRNLGLFLAVGMAAFLAVHILPYVWQSEPLGQQLATRAMGLGVALISILFITALSMTMPDRYRGWMAYVGRCSMAIYLMHVVAGSGIRILLQKAMGIQDFSIHLFAGTVGGILLPIIALKLIAVCHCSFLLRPVGRFRIGSELALRIDGRNTRMAAAVD